MRTVRILLSIALVLAAPAAALAAGAPVGHAPEASAAAGGSKPLLDLPQVLTQILGFILLVWILRATAWEPLIGFLEERRRKIAGEFEEAERRRAEADALRARYEQDVKGVEAQARQRILEAVAEGQKVAAEIRAQAHADAAARLERAEEEIVREQEKARKALKEQLAALSIRTAEKILQEKIDEPTQRRLVQRFIDDLGSQQ
jgi:F-type H+-transporting ATPase subunit b